MTLVELAVNLDFAKASAEAVQLFLAMAAVPLFMQAGVKGWGPMSSVSRVYGRARR